MKTVLTFGVFDLLHYGHIELFRRAKDLGDKLVVAVQDSDYVTKFKPEAQLVYSTYERLYMVEAIRYVDGVTSYTSVDDAVKKIKFDILVVGEDQNHSKFQEAIKWCEDNGKQIITLSRTEGISTSMIKTFIQHKE